MVTAGYITIGALLQLGIIYVSFSLGELNEMSNHIKKLKIEIAAKRELVAEIQRTMT